MHLSTPPNTTTTTKYYLFMQNFLGFALKGVINMNIICDKSKLLEGINISLKAIPGKSTMAILECMVIEAKDGIIKLISFARTPHRPV